MKFILYGHICSGAQSCHSGFCHPFHTPFNILSWGSHFNFPFSPAHVAHTASKQTSASKTCVKPVSFHLTHPLTHTNSWAPCSTLPAPFLRSSYLKTTICMKLYISVFTHTHHCICPVCSFLSPHRGWQTPNSSSPLCQGSPLFPCTCGCWTSPSQVTLLQF